MQINKSDILNFIQNIQKREAHHDQTKLHKADKSHEAQTTEPQRIQIDAVRSHVMNLQTEVKDIQTRISQKQVQIAFLENLPADKEWKGSLKEFLQDKFPANPVKMDVAQNSDRRGYISDLMNEIGQLNNSLLTREVKLENIFSSGMIDFEKADISEIIMKDFSDVTRVFSRIRKDSISHLFQV